MPKAEIEQARRRAPPRCCRSSRCSTASPAELSGGQRQRVAIGRALVRDVDVFLFDEPLSNLDAKLRAELRVEIKRLHQRLGNTMIYVTHDQIEALTLADRIAVMKERRHPAARRRRTTIYHRPANRFVAGFVGSPAMNFLPRHASRMTTARRTSHAGGCRVPLDGYRLRRRGRRRAGRSSSASGPSTSRPASARRRAAAGRDGRADGRRQRSSGAASATHPSLDAAAGRGAASRAGATRARSRLPPHRLNLFDAETGAASESPIDQE